MSKNKSNCILIKRSEYEKLKNKDITINIDNDYCGRYAYINKSIVITLSSNIINLVSSNLLHQINRIKWLISESLENKFKEQLSEINLTLSKSYNNGYNDAVMIISKMSYWEFRKFKKEYGKTSN